MLGSQPMSVNVQQDMAPAGSSLRGLRLRRIVAWAVAAVLGSGCRGVGEFVWVDAYKDTKAAGASSAYVLSRGDQISVKVWNQDALSGRVRIRNDGMISLPFVNDIAAAGVEPAALAMRLQVLLKDFIVNPVVTVAVEEQSLLEVSVIGEVAKPGVFRVEPDTGLLKVLATAGGLNPLAERDRIFVLRQAESAGAAHAVEVRIRFTYDALARAQGPSARFRLRSGDVVVVE